MKARRIGVETVRELACVGVAGDGERLGQQAPPTRVARRDDAAAGRRERAAWARGLGRHRGAVEHIVLFTHQDRAIGAAARFGRAGRRRRGRALACRGRYGEGEEAGGKEGGGSGGEEEVGAGEEGGAREKGGAGEESGVREAGGGREEGGAEEKGGAREETCGEGGGGEEA